MPSLSLAFLGPPQVTLGDQPLVFTYDKVLALLAYLAVEADTAHRRDALAGLLWPDQDDRVARHSLSQALFTLRNALGDRDADPPLIRAQFNTIQLNPACACDLDVAAFTKLLAGCTTHAPHPDAACANCAAQRAQAVALYRGDFLQHFQVPDSSLFEEWALVQREHLHQQALQALACLGDYHEQRDDLSQACTYLRRQIELEPWHEEAHRQLMRVLAHDGQRAAALAQYERCRQVLDAELGVEPEEATMALYERIRAGDTETRRQGDKETRRPVHPLTRSPLHDLPEQPTPFIGRERELADLAALLDDPACRLVTLVGPGGIGKTRLALAAAEQHTLGVAFVPLAALHAPELIIPGIADAIGLHFYGQDDPQTQLRDYLCDKSMLLVLDNCEHLLDGVEIISAMLEQTPRVTVLATSRERLNLRGEQVFEVEGLDVPLNKNEAIEHYSAVQLFTQSAQRARATFALHSSDHAHVIRICQLVGGMPLGIELAAAWTSVLPCGAIAAEIEHTLDFLATTMRDVPERHRSMRAVFDHSWRLLSERECAVFMRLSIFRDGFTREAAAHVAEANLPVLLALANKSLLRQRNDERYEIHELLRQYGERKLQEDANEDQRARERHCHHYLTFVALREEQLKGRNQQTALQEIAAETENIRAAWEWATQHHTFELIADAVGAFWLANEIRGRYHDGNLAFNQAAVVLHAIPARQRSRKHLLALGKLCVYHGSFFIRLGDYDRIRELEQEGIAVLRPLGAEREVGLALNFRAAGLHLQGDYAEARRVLEESIALAQTSSDRWLEAYSLNDLGMALHLLGDTPAAEQHAHASLAIFKQIDDQRGMAFAISNLGVFARHMGRYAEAKHLLNEGLLLWRINGHQWGVATTLTHLGVVAQAHGAGRASREYFLQALQVAVEIRALPTALDVLNELAALLAHEGQFGQAFDILAVTLHHPACSQSVHDQAERLLTQLRHQLPAHVFLATQRNAPTRTVEALIEHLLHDTSVFHS